MLPDLTGGARLGSDDVIRMMIHLYDIKIFNSFLHIPQAKQTFFSYKQHPFLASGTTASAQDNILILFLFFVTPLFRTTQT